MRLLISLCPLLAGCIGTTFSADSRDAGSDAPPDVPSDAVSTENDAAAARDAGTDAIVVDAPVSACVAAGGGCSTEFPCCAPSICSHVPGPAAGICHSPFCCYSDSVVHGPYPCDTTGYSVGFSGDFQVQCDMSALTCTMVGQTLAGVGVVMPCEPQDAGPPSACPSYDAGFFAGDVYCCGSGICRCEPNQQGCTETMPVCSCPSACVQSPNGFGAVGCE